MLGANRVSKSQAHCKYTHIDFGSWNAVQQLDSEHAILPAGHDAREMFRCRLQLLTRQD